MTKIWGKYAEIGKILKFKNLKNRFCSKKCPKKFWKFFLLRFLEKMHGFPQNITNSAHFKHFYQNMGPNGQKWPKSGKKKIRKKPRRPKKKFRTIFLYFLKKYTFSRKYQKSEKSKKLITRKILGGAKKKKILAKNIFCQLIGQFQAIWSIFAAFMAKCQNSKF